MHRSILILIFLTGLAGAAELRLSVDGAAAYAVDHHPLLAAARLRIDEARGQLRQSGRLANPELEAEAFRNVRSAEGTWSVGFMQKFPVTARLRLEKAVSAAELRAAEAEVRDEERKLAGEVRALAVQALAQREQQALREKQIGHSRELSEFLQKRVAAGEASALEASQVELEAQQLAVERLQLDVQRTTLLGELRTKLGTKPATEIEITGDLPVPGRLPAGGAQPESRADFLAARARIAAAERGLELARAQKWEDVGVGVGVDYGRNDDEGAGIERETSVGLKFSLPLPFWNKNEGRIDEAAATVARSTKEAEALAVGIRNEAAAARSEMAIMAKVIAKLGDELIPAASKLEEQFRSNYATGLTTLPEVLRARSKRLELERQRLDALRDYHLARARYRTAIGDSPAPAKNTNGK